MKILNINVFYWIDLCPWYIHTLERWLSSDFMVQFLIPFFSFSASFNHHSNRKALIMSCKQWQCLRTSYIGSRNYVVSNISYYYLLIVRKWISIYSCINEMPHKIQNMRLYVYCVSIDRAQPKADIHFHFKAINKWFQITSTYLTSHVFILLATHNGIQIQTIANVLMNEIKHIEHTPLAPSSWNVNLFKLNIFLNLQNMSFSETALLWAIRGVKKSKNVS